MKNYNQVQKTPQSTAVATDADETMVELKKVYWYEKQLLIAIPMLLKSARSMELVESLQMLKKHTKQHVKSLEKKFPNIGLPQLFTKKKA